MAQPILTVSSAAAGRIAQLLQKRGKPSVGIRIGVRTRGCSGLSYTIEYADEAGKFDEVVEVKRPEDESEENEESGGAGAFKVIIDPKAVMFLINTEMDYVEEKLKSGFVFRNPNEKGRCGCGESFHV